MSRRTYDVDIRVNGQPITQVIIDPHYELRHSDSIDDELILALVLTLDGQEHVAEIIQETYTYFVTDKIDFRGHLYKLIWLMEDQHVYIGVINAYRRR